MCCELYAGFYEGFKLRWDPKLYMTGQNIHYLGTGLGKSSKARGLLMLLLRLWALLTHIRKVLGLRRVRACASCVRRL